MTLPRLILLIALLTSASLACLAASRASDDDLTRYAREVIDEHCEEVSKALTSLREAGPAGLEALRREHAELLALGPLGAPPGPPYAWQHLTYAMDTVAAAHDAYASGLYWYTDLDQAKAAAKASGKPILSLRLLGDLDSDLSCANSRYFRTVLYANQAVAGYLRDNYILHWKSVRKAPRIVIDFGDGRRLERTITGNSIHYILDSDGNVVDALPGLLGPGAFLHELQDGVGAAHGTTTPQARASYAANKASAIADAWKKDLATLGIAPPPQTLRPGGAAPNAAQAAPLAVSKSRAEQPMLRQIFPAAAMQAVSDGAGWARIAALRRSDAELDAGSLRLMQDKSPLLRAAGPVGTTSPMITAFTDSIALDTVRNQYLMHRTVCDWLSEARGTVDLDELNRRVYAELFLTPDSDPWLGLLPQDVYTAIDNDGVHEGPALR